MTSREPEIEWVRARDLHPGAATPGIRRLLAFDVPGVLVAQSVIEPKAVSDWHHHGSRTLFGHLAQGALRFDYGPRGTQVARLLAGDYFRIPPGAIHRDVNPSDGERALVIAVLVGDGPPTVNVPGPSEG
jgi:quercetin dioxygenase-like cupin family protein